MITTIKARLADITQLRSGEISLVAEAPKIGDKIIRSHINLRERDLKNARISGDIKKGGFIKITGEISEYFNNNQWKISINDIQSIAAA